MAWSRSDTTVTVSYCYHGYHKSIDRGVFSVYNMGGR